MSDDDMRKWETEASRARYESDKKKFTEEKKASESTRQGSGSSGSDGCAGAAIPGIILLGTAAAALHQHLAPLFS